MATLKNGATYRLANRADGNRSLNVYGTAPKSLANVCLYRSSNSDICQKWVYREVGGHKYFVCKGNTGLALDLLTDASAGSNVNNYNAHVYAPSDTSYVTILGASDGNSRYIRIRLANNSSKYLTANQGSNGTAAGKDVNAAGNVYWYKGGLTDFSQDWEPILLEDASTPTTPGKYSKNYLIYPTSVMNITQSYNGDYNHYLYSGGTPCDYPIDEACEDTGRSPFLCPCDEMRVAHIYTKGTNTIWIESTSPVVTPSGTFNVVIMVMHPEDDDLFSLSEGQTFKRGETIFREGQDGNATGNHFHMSVGTGSFKGGANGWVENSKGAWVLTPTGKTIKPEQAFYVDSRITTIKDSKGLNFRSVPD